MRKLSYGIITILLLLLTSFLSFRTPVLVQGAYPTDTPTTAPTAEPDSCTGSVSCLTPVVEEITGCNCSTGKMNVTVQCRPLTGGAYTTCPGGCNPSSACGPTLAWTGCLACPGTFGWTDVPQNDCAGSSCGCNQRRTTARYCNGTHCYDTCVADTSCTAECVIPPTPTNTPYFPPPNPTDTVTYGSLSAKAVIVSGADTSCTAISASTSYLTGALVDISPYIADAKLQTTGVITWTYVPTTGATVYGVSSTPPGQYTLANICVSQDGGASVQGTAGALTANGSLDFVIAYLPQSGWVQTVGGDVHAGSTITSSIPSTLSTYFNMAGAMGDAGIVSYGNTYDFSLDYAGFGEAFVSPKKWLVHYTYPKVNYYEHFTKQMDIPGSATHIDAPVNLAQSSITCATNPCVYYADTNMTTNATDAWAFDANAQTVIFVNGNVTINKNITLASGGFFSMIVNGNITVDPSVTLLQGVYIASNATNTALFSTGQGSTQLFATGSVVADNFVLERDLGSALNLTTPGEVFTFNPQLLFTMPDAMKETPYIWQEVAP